MAALAAGRYYGLDAVVELLDGPPYGAAPVTNDAGEVVATPLVDPTLRTGFVIAGLVVLFVWGSTGWRRPASKRTTPGRRASRPTDVPF